MIRSPTWFLRATHNHVHGMPAGGLHAALVHHRLVFTALAAAVLAALSLLGHPAAGVLTSALMLAAHHLVTRRRQARIRYGALGEERAARQMRRIPDCHVFHDVPLGQENCDHVIVTREGVFSVEVKNHRDVLAHGAGLFIRGRPRPDVLSQARREAAKLHRLTGLPVKPLVVFAHPATRLRVRELGGVTLTHVAQLPHAVTRLRRAQGTPLSVGEQTRAVTALQAALTAGR